MLVNTKFCKRLKTQEFDKKKIADVVEEKIFLAKIS